MEHILLMGMMGSGKTTVGRLLAEKLQLPFTDLDAFIETEEKKTIPEIFEQDGEPHFRKLETQYLKQLLSSDRQVISLGGGTACCDGNLGLINELGMSIYLQTDVPLLVQRLEGQSADRPMLSEHNSLEKIVTALMNEREAHYLQASHTIKSKDGDPEKAVEEIVRLINIT